MNADANAFKNYIGWRSTENVCDWSKLRNTVVHGVEVYATSMCFNGTLMVYAL